MLDKIKNIKIPTVYFSLVFLGYILTLPFAGLRMGIFSSLLLVAIIVEIGLFVIKSDNKSDFISLINICVLAYAIYNFFSFIWIMKNGYPVSIYAEEFSNSILPIVFYFVAAIMCKNEDEKNNDCTELIYKAFLYSFAIYSFISIVMYVWAPQFYCDYLVRIGMISKADAATCHVRMESFTGSTILSYLGVAAMLVAAKFMYKCASNKKSVKELIIYSALFVFNLIVVFMANGRAGMVAALLVIVYINFLVFFTFKFVDKKYLYIELGLIAAIVIAICFATPGIAAKVWARLVSLPGAIGQRSEQWIAAINNMPGGWHGQWFGNGLGANGHKAIGIDGAHIVADGGLVKLYCEEGAIGFALYVFIFMIIFRAGAKNLKKYFAELGIIGTALLMSVGSNIIAFQLCLPIVFFAAGVVGKDTKSNGLLDDKQTPTEVSDKEKEIVL